MQLFMVFGAVALFIATLGVYAVTSYGVSQRRREMNIRVALGARSRQVMLMVMLQGAAPIAAGICVGVGLARAGSRHGRERVVRRPPRRSAGRRRRRRDRRFGVGVGMPHRGGARIAAQSGGGASRGVSGRPQAVP